jgi:hypothetical protein
MGYRRAVDTYSIYDGTDQVGIVDQVRGVEGKRCVTVPFFWTRSEGCK